MKSHHFIAVVVVFTFIGLSSVYAQQTAEQLYQSALYKEEIEGELDAAIKIYEAVIKQYPENRPSAAKSLLHSGICKERLGIKEAQKAYERVVRDYADQSDIVAQAKVRLSGLGRPEDKKGFVTRRILQDATGVEGRLTSDGRCITGLNLEKGDVYPVRYYKWPEKRNKEYWTMERIRHGIYVPGLITRRKTNCI